MVLVLLVLLTFHLKLMMRKQIVLAFEVTGLDFIQQSKLHVFVELLFLKSCT